MCKSVLVMVLLLCIVFFFWAKMYGGGFADGFVLVKWGRRFPAHGKRNCIQLWFRALVAKGSRFATSLFPVVVVVIVIVIVVRCRIFLPVVIWGCCSTGPGIAPRDGLLCNLTGCAVFGGLRCIQ